MAEDLLSNVMCNMDDLEERIDTAQGSINEAREIMKDLRNNVDDADQEVEGRISDLNKELTTMADDMLEVEFKLESLQEEYQIAMDRINDLKLKGKLEYLVGISTGMGAMILIGLVLNLWPAFTS